MVFRFMRWLVCMYDMNFFFDSFKGQVSRRDMIQSICVLNEEKMVFQWSDWYDWLIDVGHDSFILCHGGGGNGARIDEGTGMTGSCKWDMTHSYCVIGGGLTCILTCFVYSVSYHMRCATWLFRIVSWRRRTYFSQQASTSYCMTQYEGVMSHICEPVIPIASSIRTPFPPPHGGRGHTSPNKPPPRFPPPLLPNMQVSPDLHIDMPHS